MKTRLTAPKDDALPDRLLTVGEVLYARDGFNGVSLRQICVAAGAKNNFAIQYHFGDVEAFAAAMVERRSIFYEMRRGELLAKAAREGSLTPRKIVEILAMPIIEHVDEASKPVGARFMLALLNTTWGWRPLDDLLPSAPVTQQLIRSLEESLPHLPPPVIWQRLFLTSTMIFTCVSRLPDQATAAFRDAVMENVFVMATSAVCQPLDADSAAAMCEFHREKADDNQ